VQVTARARVAGGAAGVRDVPAPQQFTVRLVRLASTGGLPCP
jgi:hypothetical protein